VKLAPQFHRGPVCPHNRRYQVEVLVWWMERKRVFLRPPDEHRYTYLTLRRRKRNNANWHRRLAIHFQLHDGKAP
jgi:hypothetical protein